jgi:hypothetical protein
MAITLTADDARQSLNAHLVTKGIEIFSKYGGVQMGREGLQRLLADRTLVRYPCEIVFDETPLQPGEFAVPVQQGNGPDDGFVLFVHPQFQGDESRLPHLVLYQLVAVNYGEFASAHDAESFGAAALGMTVDEYYDMLCAVADDLGAESPACGLPPAPAPHSGCGCGGSGSCSG